MTPLLLLACTTTPETPPIEATPLVDPWAASIVDASPIDPVVEQLADDWSAVAPSGDLSLFANRSGELALVDPWGTVSALQTSVGAVHAVVQWREGHLLSTTSGYHLFNGALAEVELSLAPAEALFTDPWGDLWIETAASVNRLRGETLSALTIADAPASSAVVGELDERPVIWTHDATHVVALDRDLQIVHSQRMFGTVTDLATNHNGGVLALVDGWMVAFDGTTWTRLDAGAPVRALHGNDTSTVWAQTDDGWMLQIGSSWRSFGDVSGEASGVDAMGRLIVREGSNVRRLGAGRPLRILEVPEQSIELPTFLPIAVTALDEAAITVVLSDGSREVELDVVDESGVGVWIDPGDHAPGVYTLTVEATYTSGPTSTAETPLQLGAFLPTWSNWVLPLYRTKCAACHPATAQPDLATRTDWVTNYEDVYYDVANGIMPRVEGQELTPLEVDLLEQWRDAGFPE